MTFLGPPTAALAAAAFTDDASLHLDWLRAQRGRDGNKHSTALGALARLYGSGHFMQDRIKGPALEVTHPASASDLSSRISSHR